MGAFRRRWPGVSYGRGEDWHYVGDTGEPAFQNGWANVANAPKLAFRQREAGVVDIQGTIDSGTNVIVFTLPEGYRPSVATAVTASGYTAAAGRLAALVSITADGVVRVFVDPTGGGSTYPELVNFGSAQLFLNTPAVA